MKRGTVSCACAQHAVFSRILCYAHMRVDIVNRVSSIHSPWLRYLYKLPASRLSFSLHQTSTCCVFQKIRRSPHGLFEKQNKYPNMWLVDQKKSLHPRYVFLGAGGLPTLVLDLETSLPRYIRRAGIENSPLITLYRLGLLLQNSAVNAHLRIETSSLFTVCAFGDDDRLHCRRSFGYINLHPSSPLCSLIEHPFSIFPKRNREERMGVVQKD
jgi:hypothetical protein